MILKLLKKEINDLFNSKTTILFIFLFSAIITYSFYSAVNLYSKASVAAIGNPLYATGFEPVNGIFVPTFGGLFMLLSIISPFLFIQSISKEKKYNTLPLLAQFPMSLKTIFITKLLSTIFFLSIIIMLISPLLIIWHLLGGHIAISEIMLLSLGYFLYGIFIISISFFSASIFNNSSQASIMALSLIMISWFIDFGKDMNILPFINKIYQFSITKQLNYFENGILSLQTILYFILLISFFSILSYIFFNFSIKNKIKPIALTFTFFLSFLYLTTKININFDLTESKKNSFPEEYIKFLKKIPPINITIYLKQTDSRAKDYENDFLKKLKLVKNNIYINYITGKELDKNYGIFKYTINGKTETTYSNSEEEIFMIFEELSGIKINKTKNNKIFKGYPLVVENDWSMSLFIIYLIIIPIGSLSFYLKKQKNI